MYENWKDGYDTDLDRDLDGYNDNWEEQISNTTGSNFDKTVNDSYYLDEKSVGHIYEETRCRNIQLNYTKIMNQFDWSYDPTSKIIGKQWK